MADHRKVARQAPVAIDPRFNADPPHLSREREAEYRLALPRSEVAAGGSLRRHADRCDDRLGLGEQGRVDN
jgi:hypothetical protein